MRRANGGYRSRAERPIPASCRHVGAVMRLGPVGVGVDLVERWLAWDEKRVRRPRWTISTMRHVASRCRSLFTDWAGTGSDDTGSDTSTISNLARRSVMFGQESAGVPAAVARRRRCRSGSVRRQVRSQPRHIGSDRAGERAQTRSCTNTRRRSATAAPTAILAPICTNSRRSKANRQRCLVTVIVGPHRERRQTAAAA